MKMFAPNCINDDIGLTLTFLWQGQICLPGFYVGRVSGTCKV